MTTLSQVKPAVDVTTTDSSEVRMLVNVVSGGHEFVIETRNIHGVYQIAKDQLGKDLMVVETPEGELPLLSLADVLSEELEMPVEGTDTERALVVIEHKGEIAAIRVGSASRPIEIESTSFFGLPRVAHVNDTNNLIHATAVLDWENEDPNEAIRLVVDPLAVFGFRESADVVSRPVTALADDAANVKANHGQGQILAFSPENVSRSEVDYVFCLPLSGVAEVISVHNAMEMPFKSSVFQGFILWRNQPVPIVNLGEAFGQKTIAELKQRDRLRARRLIIARASGGRYVGFYTQKQMHSMKTPVASPIEFDSLKNAPYFGAFETEFGAMVVPDLSRILDNN